MVTSERRRLIAFEWVWFWLCFFVGMFVVIPITLPDYWDWWDAHKAMFDSGDSRQFEMWAKALAPYLSIQLLRSLAWAWQTAKIPPER